MQSESHECLFKKLSAITERVKASLGENHTTLIGLAEEHRAVMEALKQAEPSQNPQLIHLIKEIKAQVNEVTEKLAKEREQTGLQLKAAGNKKKIAEAYRG